MKWSKLSPSKDRNLLTCNLCHDNIPRSLAGDGGWVVDFPNEKSTGNYYCPECQHFIINKYNGENKNE